MRRGRPARRTSMADRIKFVRMRADGKSFRAIAKETGRNTSTVFKWIKQWQMRRDVSRLKRNIRVQLRYPVHHPTASTSIRQGRPSNILQKSEPQSNPTEYLRHPCFSSHPSCNPYIYPYSFMTNTFPYQIRNIDFEAYLYSYYDFCTHIMYYVPTQDSLGLSFPS